MIFLCCILEVFEQERKSSNLIYLLYMGFEPHSGRRVVSLGKTYLPPKSTGNTQEAVAPSQHD